MLKRLTDFDDFWRNIPDTTGLLMIGSVRNICAKNCENPLILFKVTIDYVVLPFLRHSVSAMSVLCNRLT